MIRRQRGPIVYYQFERLSALPGLVHAVSTRLGGPATSAGAGLNLAYHVGDDPATVESNRRLFLHAIDHADWPAASVRQVHGDRWVAIRAADAAGLHARGWDHLPEADAMVCPDPGVLLMAYSADCPLVLLWDAAAKVVGVVHASWRCTVARLVARTVDHMIAEMGCQGKTIQAGIGPGIGPCCFEVREDVRDHARASLDGADSLFRVEAGRMTFDLWRAIRAQLLEAHLDEASIECANICTACHTDEFFSYRAEGPTTGRFAAVIGRR